MKSKTIVEYEKTAAEETFTQWMAVAFLLSLFFHSALAGYFYTISVNPSAQSAGILLGVLAGLCVVVATSGHWAKLEIVKLKP